MEPDLTYSEDGLFVAFFAENAAGETAFNELAAHSDGTAKFPVPMRAGIVSQLRAAGYRVAKGKPHKPLSSAELDAMLAELDQ